jgi:hypothetical protein
MQSEIVDEVAPVGVHQNMPHVRRVHAVIVAKMRLTNFIPASDKTTIGFTACLLSSFHEYQETAQGNDGLLLR